MKTSEKFERRKLRTRYKLKNRNYQGFPRMSIFRSNKNISVQIIDDKLGETLVSCSSLEKGSKEKLKGYNVSAAIEIGKLIAKRALEKNITNVVFDRGAYKYHGRVKALITSALEAGLNCKTCEGK